MAKPRIKDEDFDEITDNLTKLEHFKELEGKKNEKLKKTTSKRLKDKPFTKQTVNLDERRYMRIIQYCKKNKKSFQELIVTLIDDFFNK